MPALNWSSLGAHKASKWIRTAPVCTKPAAIAPKGPLGIAELKSYRGNGYSSMGLGEGAQHPASVQGLNEGIDGLPEPTSSHSTGREEALFQIN